MTTVLDRHRALLVPRNEDRLTVPITRSTFPFLVVRCQFRCQNTPTSRSNVPFNPVVVEAYHFRGYCCFIPSLTARTSAAISFICSSRFWHSGAQADELLQPCPEQRAARRLRVRRCRTPTCRGHVLVSAGAGKCTAA